MSVYKKERSKKWILTEHTTEENDERTPRKEK
jgi:hypothetical protein